MIKFKVENVEVNYLPLRLLYFKNDFFSCFKRKNRIISHLILTKGGTKGGGRSPKSTSKAVWSPIK